MEHHRCGHCRNPIRTPAAVLRTRGSGDDWYHSDCWQDVLAAEQAQYERQVAETGLAALIAPYGLLAGGADGAPVRHLPTRGGPGVDVTVREEPAARLA